MYIVFKAQVCVDVKIIYVLHVTEFSNTVEPVNKGHPRERQNMVFIDKWSLFGGFFVIFYQGRFFVMWPLFSGWSLFGVVFNTGLTV